MMTRERIEWFLPRLALLIAGGMTAYLVNHVMYTLAVAGAVVIMFVDGSLGAAAAIPIMFIVGMSGIIVGTILLPSTYDATLWRFDGLLGFHPSDLASDLFRCIPVIQWASMVAYNSIFVVLTLLALDQKRSTDLILKILVAAVLAGMFSAVMPACGPKYLAHDDLASRPRDCIPSGHFTWALLLFWHSWRNWAIPARIACGLYLILTFLATLGSEEHYLIDLAVAVPFAVAIDAMIPLDKFRFVAGLVMTLFWVLALRFGLPGFGWLSVMITVMLSLKIGGKRMLGKSPPLWCFS